MNSLIDIHHSIPWYNAYALIRTFAIIYAAPSSSQAFTNTSSSSVVV